MHACIQQFTAVRAGVEGELRLRALDGSSLLPTGADSGIPEIFHAGAWGTFCRSGRFGPPGDYDPDFPLQPDPVRPPPRPRRNEYCAVTRPHGPTYTGPF